MRPGCAACLECVNPAIPHNWKHPLNLTVGRTPRDRLFQEGADVGASRGPGGPPHESSQAAKKLMDSSTLFLTGRHKNSRLALHSGNGGCWQGLGALVARVSPVHLRQEH